MSEAQTRRRLGRSIGAVLAGFAVTAAVSLGTDAVLHGTGVFPPWGEPMSDTRFMLATVYRLVYTILGGYLTARLAPDRPMAHALTLGAVGLVVSTTGAVATWNRGPEFGPAWFPIMLVVTAIPFTWAGGKIYEDSQTAAHR